MGTGDIVGALFIDFKNDFDLVSNPVLLQKLSHYKCNNSTHRHFESYNKTSMTNTDSSLTMANSNSFLSPQESLLTPRKQMIVDI